MKKINTFLIGLFFINAAHAQDTLTLAQAVEAGLQNNYSIRIARNTSEVAHNNNKLGNAGFLPQANVNYSNTSSVTNSKAELANGNIRSGSGIKNNNQNASALLNWTVFDGFNMFINKHKLEEFQKAGEYQARMNIEINVSQIITVYYAIIEQQKMMDVIQNAINLSIERYKLAQASKNIGTGSEQTLLQALVDANADSTRYIQQFALIKNSKSDLNRLLARDVNTSFEVKDDLKVNENLVLAELNEQLNNQNAQILTQRANVNIAEYTIGNYRSQYFPTFNVFGGYNFSKNLTPVGATLLNQSHGLTYGVTASINLFNGGVTTLNMQNAKILLKSSQLQYEDIKLSLQNDMNKLYNNYMMNLQLMKIERTNVETAKKDVEIAVGRFRLGNINDVDLRVTQQKLIDAQNTLLNAEFAAKQTEIELYRLSGQLLNVLPQ